MNSTAVVVLIDQNSISKNRVKKILNSPEILENHNIKILEANNRRDIIGILNEYNYNIDLIISEMEIDPSNHFNGISLIKLIKTKRSSIPVVLLTSSCRKATITESLREGAADYILKPFRDIDLKDRLQKYINIESLTESTVLNFNLKNFLDCEIYKAKKGKYPFSLLSLQFDSSAEDESTLPRHSFYTHSELIFREIKGLFWESDIYLKHGFQSHFGYFPFCDEAQTRNVIKKIALHFKKMQEEYPQLKDYTVTCSFATYPANGKKTGDLLKILAGKNMNQ